MHIMRNLTIGVVAILAAAQISLTAKMLSDSPQEPVENQHHGDDPVTVQAVIATKLLRMRLLDPASLVIDGAWVNPKTMDTCFRFRARNRFNGMTDDAMVIDQYGLSHRSTKHWRAVCMTKTMRDENDAAQFGLSL